MKQICVYNTKVGEFPKAGFQVIIPTTTGSFGFVGADFEFDGHVTVVGESIEYGEGFMYSGPWFYSHEFYLSMTDVFPFQTRESFDAAAKHGVITILDSFESGGGDARTYLVGIGGRQSAIVRFNEHGEFSNWDQANDWSKIDSSYVCCGCDEHSVDTGA